ncbi:hypothetical protein KB1253_04260 [Lactiplantibacillus plantarum]|uniref:Uncharacterized protein n=1 Tax=Lactiplantibacillus plantarum TaxID=1590 RepID=A0A165RYG0_LACPN|nr:hypothetical protein Lp19_0597 [Lactiplantibacillus plantarum]GEK64190.1 hypothetical protein LJA01_20930 [Lactobacillus japonicus]GEL35008.1 hypothetical protein LPL02_27470 [Lactiplantibacillus plantarum subsp. plantarum]BBA82198.1 hypothetical protein SN35N_1819 [Lactiplantibacillus plantarum]BEI51324.1 hypothetical protein AWA2013_27300 [Lactiplantibacillus plantarum]
MSIIRNLGGTATSLIVPVVHMNNGDDFFDEEDENNDKSTLWWDCTILKF